MTEQLSLFTASATTSKYDITERPDGFVISALNRNPVRVTSHPTHLEISFLHRNFHGDRAPITHTANFYQYYALSHAVASGLLQFWQRPEDKQQDYEPKWLRPWATRQTARAIGRRIHKQWQRLLARVDPEVLATHKAVFVASGMNPESDFVFKPAIYGSSHIASDIQKYRACAMLASTNPDRLYRHYVAERLSTVDSNFDRFKLHRKAIDLAPEALIQNWDSWPVLYSDTSRPYTSLLRTLFNVPGGIPPDSLTNLSMVHLTRPITNRRELLLVLNTPNCLHPELITSIFQQATTAQIKTAIRRLSAHLRLDLSPNKSMDIGRLARFVADYPEPHSGNLMGLLDKSIAWHRHAQARERESLLTKYEGSTRLAQPPVALPPQPEIRLIATVDDIRQESIEMNHCVATYADEAISGECYLFHVDYRGEQATIQLDPDGEIVQASGPRNGHNLAVRWGKRQLKRWGDSIPTGARPRLFRPALRQQEIAPVNIATALGPLFNGFDIQAEVAEPDNGWEIF